MSEEIPDFDYDPTGNLDARLKRFEQGQQLAAIQQAIQADEARFAKDHPDYYEALNTIREKEADRMRLAGVPEDQIEPHLAMAELQAAVQILQNGKSAAEYAYTIAKENYGFQGGNSHADYEKQYQQETEEADSVFNQLFQETFGHEQ